MAHAKDELNFATITLTSSPKGYYVQSPRESHEDASAYQQSTLPYNNSTVMDSPLNRSSYTRTSNYRSSSASWISSYWRWPRRNRKRNSKEWEECRVVQQNVDDLDATSYSDGMDAGRPYLFILFMAFVIVFAVFCIIVWGITRRYETQVRIMVRIYLIDFKFHLYFIAGDSKTLSITWGFFFCQSLIVDDFYFGQGSDRTGVPTKFVTVNCTATMSIHNPAKFFGIYVNSNQVDLMYSEITVASGQVRFWVSYMFFLNA